MPSPAFGVTYELRASAPGCRPLVEEWASERNVLMIARDYAKQHEGAFVTVERVTTIRRKQRREVIFSTGAPALVESTEPTEYDRRTNYGAF